MTVRIALILHGIPLDGFSQPYVTQLSLKPFGPEFTQPGFPQSCFPRPCFPELCFPTALKRLGIRFVIARSGVDTLQMYERLIRMTGIDAGLIQGLQVVNELSQDGFSD
jgi:hypothetical protein